MLILRLGLLSALVFAFPAAAQDWRVEDVTGDAVAVAPRLPASPLEKGDAAPDGTTLVSGPSAMVKLTRGGDAVSLKADAVVEFRREGGARAVLEPRAGRVEVKATADPDGALRAATRFFRVDAQTASFTLDVRKDHAVINVLSGEVRVQDLTRAGSSVVLHAGGVFRGAPAKTAAAAKTADEEAAKTAAQVEGAFKDLEKLGGKPGVKLSKEDKAKRNAVVRALAEKGLRATQQGLQDMAEDYEGDPPVATPKIGILAFLFGPQSPDVGYVLAGVAAVFLVIGALASQALGAAAFGTVGNAVILLLGALAGATLHDFAFPPETFWEFEPTPGVATTTLGAALALAAACVLRELLANRWVEARAQKAQAAGRKAHEEFAHGEDNLNAAH